MMPTVDELLSLDNLKLPDKPRVDRVEWYEYIDSLGDDAYRVTVVVDIDDPFDIVNYGLELQAIEEEVFRVLREQGDRRWPYLRFITCAEYAEELAEQ